MSNPYKDLPETAFWKTAVATRNMFDIEGLWDPKFHVRPHQKVSTYGSCFAQHIGRALQGRGYRWLKSETPPIRLSEQDKTRFNYGIFSSRTGNIYTASLLKQWVQWAFDEVAVPTEVWEKDGRYFDPFRPRIEPNGFKDVEELLASRSVALEAFRQSILDANFFVFTMGLTESWINAEQEYEYPMCPGTVAGEFDPESHKFVNQSFQTIRQDMRQTFRLMRKHNAALKFILTVSPVPLTATMSDQHVLVATMASKSKLRAVADCMQEEEKFVDYFPSYEIINSPTFRGAFFEPNQRDVNHRGVEFVMDMFFSCTYAKYGTPPTKSKRTEKTTKQDVVCEEELLEAFAE